MDKYKVIRDIVKLAMKHNLHKGAHIYKVLDWYTWAVNNKHVEYVYDGEELIGFMDWIRSKTIPVSHDYQSIVDSSDVDTGEVGIVLNCAVVRGKDTLRKLIKMVRANSDGRVSMMCWHDRKAGRMRYFCWHPHMAKQTEVTHAA